MGSRAVGWERAEVLRRRLRWGLALPLAISSAIALFPAPAGAAPTLTLGASFTPIPGFPHTGAILGAGAAVELELGISGTEYGGYPPPVQSVELFMPRGVVLHPADFPTCPIAVLEPTGQGASACPAGSAAGPVGTALTRVAFGSQIVPETAAIEAFYEPEGDLSFPITGSAPLTLETIATAHVRAASGLYSHELSLEVPPVETVPAGPKLSLESLDVKFGSAVRQNSKTIYYLRLPQGCPKGGFPFLAEVSFAAAGDLPRQTVAQTFHTPCPRKPAAVSLPAGEVLTSLEGAAPHLTAYDGYVVFSHESAAGRWQLEDWHDGAVTALNVPERSVPFDADAGPAPGGAPAVVFSKCAHDPSRAQEWGRASGCHVYELALPDGTPRLIRGIYAAKASDTTPALWGTEIAFARLSRTGRSPAILVWNRNHRRLSRVGGGPTRCEAYSPQPCNRKPRVLAWVQEMSLGPTGLAYQWALPEAIPGFGSAYAQIRFDPLTRGHQAGATKVIFDSILGGACNGQQGSSPVLAGNRVLYVWRTSICVGEPLDARISAYEPSTGASAGVTADPLAAALAEDGRYAYWISLKEVPGQKDEDSYAESCEPAISTCELMRSETLLGELAPR